MRMCVFLAIQAQIKFKSKFTHSQTYGQHKLFPYLAVMFVILLTCADYFLRLLFCHSYLSLNGNQLQQLPAAVFSGLTSLRSHVVFVCNENVCILGDTGT